MKGFCMAHEVTEQPGRPTGNSDLLELQRTLYASKNPTRCWLHNRRRDWIETAIRGCSLKVAGSALEIGPGSGLYLPILSECFGAVTAIDVEETFLQNAARFSHDYDQVHCLLDDITKTALPPESFDLVLCTEVIEHIGDAEAALRNMRRILKKDGILVLSTPHRYSPLELCSKIAYLPLVIDLVRKVYGEAILDAGHINLTSGRSLRRLITATGFRIVRQEAFGCYLPLVAEFCGQTGLALEQKLESIIAGSCLEELLWTQAYILSPGHTTS